MESTMYLTSVTVIDHAYIDHKGRIVGGSFNPHFIVTGEVDELEKVVVDFSSIKKSIKAIIDHPKFGIDHKLLGFTDSAYTKARLPTEDKLAVPQIEIVTPAVTIRFPADAFQEILVRKNSLASWLGDRLVQELSPKYPGIRLKIKAVLATDITTPMPGRKDLFRYTHGLRDSTSWGCQNIAHGHLSYLQILHEDIHENLYDLATDEFELLPKHFYPSRSQREEQRVLLGKQIASFAHNTMFIREENLNAIPGVETTLVSYTSRDRGSFSIDIHNPELQKTQVLPTETTVEFLAEYLCGKFREELKAIGAKALLVSEGLTKGAIAYV